jgi:hypothetical protein
MVRFHPLIIVNVSQYDSDSINFSAPTFVAGLRNARAIGHGATQGFSPL